MATRNEAKPAKPHKDYPLFAHAAGIWAKKVKGRMHYFGPWSDPDAALAKWLDEKDDLLAGRKPRGKRGGLTVLESVNKFLTAKKMMVNSGELSLRSFANYHGTCGRLVAGLGKERLVVDLDASDFESLRATLAVGRGPVALGNEIRHVRVWGKYLHDAGLIESPVRFGPQFRVPSKKVLRQSRAAGGPKSFQADEVRRLIDAAGIPLKAMVLLGINAGFGPTDVARLPQSALDLERGWIEFPRPKTAIARRCPLWPETVAALRVAIEARPEPKSAEDAGLVFLTRFGRPWLRVTPKGDGASVVNAVTFAFGKIVQELGLKSLGRSFYGLRRGLETIGGGGRDQVAVDALMGHSDPSMAAVYRQGIEDDRLVAVANVVRFWLWPDAVKPATSKRKRTVKAK